MATITPRVAVSALFALDGAALGGWMAHLPDAQRRYGLSTGALGTVLVASSLGALSAMWLTGAAIHRFGSRRVSLATAAGLLLLVPPLLRAPSVPGLALTLFLMGATNGTLDVAMNAHSVAVQERLDRPILSSVHGWWSLGGFAGGLGTSLASARGIAAPDHLLLASFALALLLPLARAGLLPADADRGEAGSRFVVPRGRLLALGLLTLVAFFSEGVLWDWSAVYLRGALGASESVAALGFGIAAGAMAVGRLLGDRAVARLGPAGALRLAGALTGGGILLGAASPNVMDACGGFALASLGLANTVPVLFAAAARVPGVSAGAGLAAVTTLGYAAFLGGPPLVGHIAELTSLRIGVGVVGIVATTLGIWGPRVVGAQNPETRETNTTRA